MARVGALTQEQVIERIKTIHGDRYDLSKVQFRTINHKITLVCPEHGDFDILPKTIFLQHSGCRKCKYVNDGVKRRKTIEQFIAEAQAIHGDTYDYSRVTEYKNNRSKLTIVCPTHGAFTKSADDHINKQQGCKWCAYKGGKGGYTHSYFEHNPEEKDLPGILYAVRFTNGMERFIKIGITAKTTKHRFGRSEYKDMTVEVMYEKPMPLYDAFCIEQNMLEKLKQYRFFSNTQFSGYTECFKAVPEVLAEVQRIFINI